MAESNEAIIVRENRKRACWALIIGLFFVPISGILVYLGAELGREDIGCAIVTAPARTDGFWREGALL